MKILIFIIIAILCYWVSGIIHELGHIVVGLVNGWKFYMLTVGPFGLKADKNGKIKVYFEKHIMSWGGVGSTLPQNKNADNVSIWSKVLLGGPISSIIMGCIFLPLGFAYKNIALLLLGAMPLGMGIVCALPLPLKTGITYTDGARWSRLHKGGQDKAEEIALFKMVEHNLFGSNYSEIRYSDFEPLLFAKLDTIKYYGNYYAYRYYQARQDDENMKKAFECMNELKKNVPRLVVEDCKIS